MLHLTYPTAQTTLPFSPDLKRSPRLQVLDTGMLNYFSNIQRDVFTSNDLNNLYKGRIAEHIVAQEMIVSSDNYLAGVCSSVLSELIADTKQKVYAIYCLLCLIIGIYPYIVTCLTNYFSYLEFFFLKILHILHSVR